MRAGSALLDPAGVQGGGFESIWSQRRSTSGNPQAVPVGDEDHGHVRLPLAALMSRSTSASVKCSRLF